MCGGGAEHRSIVVFEARLNFVCEASTHLVTPRICFVLGRVAVSENKKLRVGVDVSSLSVCPTVCPALLSWLVLSCLSV